MNSDSPQITSPHHPQLDSLCQFLREHAATLSRVDIGPGEQLERCAEFGVLRWFVPEDRGGLGFSSAQIAEGYLKLGASCLTTTFVITQWVAAVKRLLACENQGLCDQLLPELLQGRSHITVGISHLTTSRRHLSQPALLAVPTDEGGFRLTGYSPWVTGASFTKYILVGAQLESGQQILALVSTDAPGIKVREPQQLLALSSSQTGSVHFNELLVTSEDLVAGPTENVLATLSASNTGSAQTSTLALSLASAAIEFLEQQAESRIELLEKAATLRTQWQQAVDDAIQLSEGDPVCSSEDLRTRSNSLVLRTTQAAMVAAKGAGFVTGHRVERWCRQAMFFLVWSCPQAVQDANLCELAGIQ